MSLEVKIKKKLKEFTLESELNVETGCTGLMGPSGSGKSITLKCIAGVETADSGRIVLDGKILYDSEKKIDLPPQKRKIGYLFQGYALFPNMTIEENIKTGLRAKGFPKDEIEQKTNDETISYRRISKKISKTDFRRAKTANSVSKDACV